MSFVQARYVHWRILGKCPIHKNTFVVVQLFVKAQYSYLIQFLVHSVLNALHQLTTWTAIIFEITSALRAAARPLPNSSFKTRGGCRFGSPFENKRFVLLRFLSMALSL